MSSIFSTYSTGENRVTASLLAVLRSLSLDRMGRLISALLEESEFELVRFRNQPKGAESVPDAIIQASVRILVETKIQRGMVSLPQIKRHLRLLDAASEDKKVLLIVTPDDSRPDILDALNSDQVVWSSFMALDQAIDEMLGDKYEVTSEREAFLLRELQNMLAAEEVLASDNDVLVVAARDAWPEYNKVHAYVCQPNRPFQRVSRMAFYSKGQIYPLVPRIIECHDEVPMIAGENPGKLGELVEQLIRDQRQKEGERYKVLLLSAPDSSETIRLPAPIPNNLKSKSGKPTAFTMGHRYVTSERLLAARATSDLIERNGA